MTQNIVKKLSKNEKKALKMQKLKFELSLLFPSLSFFLEQYKAALKDGAKENDNFMILTNTIIKRLLLVTSPYKSLSIEVTSEVNNAIDAHCSKGTNYYLIGLSLLSYHNEIQIKQIKVCLTNECSDIFDIFSSEGDSDMLNKNSDYAELLVIDLKKKYNIA